MKHFLLSMVLSSAALMLSCDSVSDREPASLQVSQIYDRHLADPLMVSVGTKTNQRKLVSLSLSYVGKTGLRSTIEEHQKTIKDLVRSSLADFSLLEIKTEVGKDRFQKSILNSLNSFIENNKFLKVEIVQVREI